LNFISYILNVKFIILCDPSDRLCPSGISCLGTTNTTFNEYIILYKSKFNTYQLVYDVTYKNDKSIFSKEDLNDIIIYEMWKTQCGESDEKTIINKINYLYKPNRYIYDYKEEKGKVIINEKLDSSNELDLDNSIYSSSINLDSQVD